MNSPFASTKTTEAINLNEVSSVLMQRGYMVYRPEADVGGVDFLLASPYGVTYKCQLKSRAFVHWNKYGDKGLHMVFPGKGDAGAREWYLVPHDELFQLLKSKHGHAPMWNHPTHAEHWHCPVSKDLAEDLERHSIQNAKIGGSKQYFNHELKREMFNLDSVADWEKCHAIGHSIDGYALLPDDANLDIMRSLYERYERDDLDVPLELTSLRLIFFFYLRMCYHAGIHTDEDNAFLNKIMRSIRSQLSD